MEIINKHLEQIQFCDVSAGDVFLYNNCPYIKTNSENAVCLDDGIMDGFYATTYVAPVKAKLIIE